MAKIKVRPRPGALSELLKTKGMTQMDAKARTRVDRKTLLKIERGEEVKKETLQQVANKLQVTEEYFSHPPEAAETTDGDPDPGTILLRKLDMARLEEFLGNARRLEWLLNVKIRDEETRQFLENFENTVEDFRRHPKPGDVSTSGDTLGLRGQLSLLRTADDIAAGMERFAEHRLALLGAEHLFWECSYEQRSSPDHSWNVEHYSSSSMIILSVEPFGTQSRRVHYSVGNPPPFLADTETPVFVNGRQLPSLDEL